MLKRFLLLFAFFVVPALAQGPDCPLQQATFTTTGTLQYDNRSTGCNSWSVYYVADTAATVSLSFQSTNGQTVPGSWVTYTGNTQNSSPSFGTATAGMAVYCGLATCVSSGVTVETSWLRVSVATLTGGTLRVFFYGYRTGAGGGGSSGGGGTGCAGTVGTPCVVDGTAAPGSTASNPVPTALRDDSGNVAAANAFTLQAAPTVSAATAMLLKAGVAAKLIYVGHVSFSLAAGTTVQFVQGTTTTTPCDTAQAALTGLYENTTAIALDFTPASSLHTTTTGDDLCAVFGASSTGGGLLEYSQR